MIEKIKGEKEYRALTGINYVHKDTGKSHRVEIGEKIEGLNEVAVKSELLAGNIEVITHKKTKKVGE